MNTKNKLFSGKVAFELYDTYGFPLDLTQMILKEKGIEINVDEFNEAMQEQKERSKANWIGSGDKQINELYLKIDNKTNFTGYEETTTNGIILKLIKDNKFVEKVEQGDNVEIIVNNTCFYGESGGQVGDTGMIMLLNQDGSIPLPFAVIQVNNTIKSQNGVFIHRGIVEMGSFTVGDSVNLAVDKVRRNKITANHSATHLLHFALKQLLGNSVNQKGSYVDDKRLRFDVSYNGAISVDILKQAENIVNNIIINNTKSKIEIMDIESAKASGAMALFSEKYGDTVRVVSMGTYNIKNNVNIEQKENYNIEDVNNSINDLLKETSKDFCSVELCGGTHVKQTGDIGFFKIVKEESIASGVRRIEALTGIEALNYVNEKIDIIDGLAGEFKISYDKVVEKIENILKENKDLKKQLNDIKKSQLNNIELDKNVVNGISVFTQNLESVEPQDLKQVIINWQNIKYKENSIVVVTVKNENKIILIVAVSKDIINKINAVDLFKKLGGKGGGAPSFAMGSVDAVIDFDNIKSNI